MKNEQIRNRNCGSISIEDVGKIVVLDGWVYRIRDLGNKFFFTLRDRYSVIQILCESEDAIAKAKDLGFEYCVSLEGEVRQRPSSMVNDSMDTGKFEIVLLKLNVLSKCKTLPFSIEDSNISEELKQKYRYLYLRTPRMQKRIALRNKVTYLIRQFFQEREFFEIETPTLIKSTPEGARDFLVPSRLNKGKFWALPQSPQLFKQLLMASGFDKYFQIAHCFRDEDPRGDRQVEHTQIDVEMSFVSEEMVYKVMGELFQFVFENAIGYKIDLPLKVISYKESLDKYGTDKPDLRYGLEIEDVTSLLKGIDFAPFNAECIKCLKIEGTQFSRKELENLEEVAKVYRAKNLYFAKVKGSSFEGGISKFLKDNSIISHLGCKDGDTLFFIADTWKIACLSMGAVRVALANKLNLINKNEFKFCIINEFPLFSYNEENAKWEAEHHIFTMPKEEYLEGDLLEKNPGIVKGQLYDLVLNGYELASGSIRIFDSSIQNRVFKIIGIEEEEARAKFGFLLEAFEYGPPPHGGFASGLDRVIMIMAQENTIKEVIAFPKNNLGMSLMDGSPCEVDESTLNSLSIEIIK